MPEPTVFIVDDDQAFSESLAMLLSASGFKTSCWNCPEAFLANFDHNLPGCIILDVHMPSMNGLDLQRALAIYEPSPPIIFVTGNAEVPTAISAMRQGACEFLQKTTDEPKLIDSLRRALAKDAANRARCARLADLNNRFATLTHQEIEVLDLILQGHTNKAISSRLNIVTRTVEDRRARLMRKLDVESVAQLVHLAIEAGRIPPHDRHN